MHGWTLGRAQAYLIRGTKKCVLPTVVRREDCTKRAGTNREGVKSVQMNVQNVNGIRQWGDQPEWGGGQKLVGKVQQTRVGLRGPLGAGATSSPLSQIPDQPFSSKPPGITFSESGRVPNLAPRAPPPLGSAPPSILRPGPRPLAHAWPRSDPASSLPAFPLPGVRICLPWPHLVSSLFHCQAQPGALESDNRLWHSVIKCVAQRSRAQGSAGWGPWW